MRRVIRLLLLVFTTLGALVVGAMWAVPLLPAIGPAFSQGIYRIEPQYGFVKVKADLWSAGDGCFLVSKSGSAVGISLPCHSALSSVGSVDVTGIGLAVLDASGIAKQIVTIPHWMAFAVFAAYPTYVAYHRYRRLRMMRCKGCCRECGYDLTGNESGICPECGKPIATLPGASQT